MYQYTIKTSITDVWCQICFMFNSAHSNFSYHMGLHTLWGIYWRFWDLEKINGLMTDVWQNLWLYFICNWCITDVSIYINPIYWCQFFLMCNSTYLNYFHPTVIQTLQIIYWNSDTFMSVFMSIWLITDVSIYNKKTFKTDVLMSNVFYVSVASNSVVLIGYYLWYN